MGQVINFPPVELPPRLTRLAENLWVMQLSGTPEAQAAADRLVKELRQHNYVVPDYMKGNDHD